MEESEYWRRLEFRVCEELAGLRENPLRGLWCDGFTPKRFDGTRVTGTAWMLRGHGVQETWRFILITGGRVRSWEDADWDALLPHDDVTGWLSLDPEYRTMKIDPAAAYPDAEAGHEKRGGTTS